MSSSLERSRLEEISDSCFDICRNIFANDANNAKKIEPIMRCTHMNHSHPYTFSHSHSHSHSHSRHIHRIRHHNFLVLTFLFCQQFSRNILITYFNHAQYFNHIHQGFCSRSIPFLNSTNNFKIVIIRLTQKLQV